MSHLGFSLRRCSIVSAIFLLVAGVLPAAAFAQKAKDYWAGTKLPFTYFTSKHTNIQCYQNAIRFEGCVFAVQAALNESQSKQELWTVETYNRLEVKPTITYEAGGLVFAEARKQEGKKIWEVLKQYKAERAELFESLHTLYNTTKYDQLNFGQLYAHIKANIIDKNPAAEPRITGEMVNLDMAVTEGPYSALMPMELLQDRSAGGATFVGVGIELKLLDKLLIVVRPIKGGPAQLGGIKAKDIILEVDGISMANKSTDDAVNMITGELNTPVKIKIRRGTEEKEFTLIRAKLKGETLVAEVVDGNAGSYRWLQLRDFMDADICKKLRTELKVAKEENNRAIILDLRGNPGGRLDMAACVAGLFVPPQANMVESRFLDPNTAPEKLPSKDPEELTKPVITLIDAGSASASEIVAGALQDLNRSVVLGVRSFGKGTVQSMNLFSLMYKLYKKETIATYHLPSGRTPQLVGILPSIEVYPVINPQEEDKFAYRQEDEYLKVVPAKNAPWEETRPHYIASIKNCMNANGRAKNQFDPQSNDRIMGDYQLLSAIDAIDCIFQK